MMSINTDEVNFLVYRYLEESGFHHSAYLFGYESSVITAGIDGTLIPRGALLSLLQKSVLFAEAEVFSLLSESEMDSKFEKAVGSMSLLECTTTDAAKLKALERVREDMSRVCSPHPSTSASHNTSTSNSLTTAQTSSAGATNSETVVSSSHSSNNSAVATTASSSNKTSTLSTSHNTTLGSSTTTNSSISADIHTLTTSATSLTTPSAHQIVENNGGGAIPPEQFLNAVSHYSMTTTSNASTATVTYASKSSQFQRDREFRAQQSQQLQSGATSGPPPRGPYRTATNEHKNSTSTTHNYSNSGNTVYYQPRQAGGGTPPSQRPHQNLPNSSMASSVESTSIQFLNTTNGLSSTFSSPLLQHQQQHQSGKQADVNHSAVEFLSSTTPKSMQQPPQSHNQQQPPRYLLNGNHLNAVGRKAQAGVQSAAIAGGTSVGSSGATVSSGKSSVLAAPTGGSVFDTRFYFKENQ